MSFSMYFSLPFVALQFFAIHRMGADLVFVFIKSRGRGLFTTSMIAGEKYENKKVDLK